MHEPGARVDPRTTTRTSEQQHQLQQPKRLVRFYVVVQYNSELKEKTSAEPRTRRSQRTRNRLHLGEDAMNDQGGRNTPRACD